MSCASLQREGREGNSGIISNRLKKLARAFAENKEKNKLGSST